MINNDELNLFQRQKNFNLNSIMVESKHYNEFKVKVGDELARYVYLFIKGRSNELPTYESLNKLVDKYYGISPDYRGQAISIGYGLEIFYKDGFITIEELEPIDRLTDRMDVIKPTEYRAYYFNKSYSKEIDVNAMPKYNDKRIEVLKIYLKGYMELYEKKGQIK